MSADVCSKIDLNVVKAVERLRQMLQAEDSTFVPSFSQTPDDLIKTVIMRKSPGVFLTTCKIHHFLWTFVPPIVFLLGSLGNTLAFLVLRHPATRHVSVFVYLTARSVVDEIVLTVGLLRRWIDYLVGTKLENTSAIFCKLAQFLGTSSSLLSVWLTVLLTAERALVVTFPLQGNRLVTFAKVRRAIVFLSVVCVAVSMHFFFTVDLVHLNAENCVLRVEMNGSSMLDDGSHEFLFNITSLKGKSAKSVCDGHCSFPDGMATMRWLWTTVDAIIYCYLPFCLIFSLNIVILHYVYAAHKDQYGIRAQPERLKSGSLGVDNNIRQLTIMLQVVSFSFLVTTVSIVVMKTLTQVPAMKSVTSVQTKAAFQLADTVAELLMYINHAMNFYLFCATGKRFRSRLVFLLMKCKRQTCAWFYVQQQEITTACNARCSQFSNNGQMSAQFGRKEGSSRGRLNPPNFTMKRPITCPERALSGEEIAGAQPSSIPGAQTSFPAVHMNVRADLVHLPASEVKYTPICVIFPNNAASHWPDSKQRYCPLQIPSNDV
ncbi:hypothetical protein CRM22_010711 [Opisthorchis felineus]|uniref:G-protein coupled receptors family 1 profile domain-containing protein n=1 Tax=Opisthorchis felineus TaxID=147828 RepID=A0A4S2KQC3_OPIFE|nr:hypothetical protein CRM22_010711 [Opisthorchis felineus]